MFIGKPFPSQNLSGRNKTNWKITEPPRGKRLSTPVHQDEAEKNAERIKATRLLLLAPELTHPQP